MTRFVYISPHFSRTVMVNKNKKEEKSLAPRLKSVEQTEREKTKVIAEEKYFRERINSEFANMYAEEGIFVEDLDRNVCLPQELMKRLSDIFVRIEAFDSDLPKTFGSIYEDQSYTINSFIQDTRKRIKEIKVTKMRDEKQEKCASEIEKYEREKREKVVLSKSSLDNVCERFSKLEMKCSVNVLDFEQKKEFKIMESDFHKLLDRVVKLS